MREKKSRFLLLLLLGNPGRCPTVLSVYSLRLSQSGESLSPSSSRFAALALSLSSPLLSPAPFPFPSQTQCQYTAAVQSATDRQQAPHILVCTHKFSLQSHEHTSLRMHFHTHWHEYFMSAEEPPFLIPLDFKETELVCVKQKQGNTVQVSSCSNPRVNPFPIINITKETKEPRGIL